MCSNHISRRHALQIAGGTTALAVAGCLGDDGDGGEGEDDDVEEVELGEGDVQLRFSGWGDGVERETVEDMLESYAEENPEVGIEYIQFPSTSTTDSEHSSVPVKNLTSSTRRWAGSPDSKRFSSTSKTT